ncbi:hypothetical protein [Roseobacter sp. HKCC-CH-9208]|uniref:hypothetical protein n=1 Tax=Roseobacter sp. HKCC-CH-9208 TaxID=3120339 RepID=UPI0030ED85E4
MHDNCKAILVTDEGQRNLFDYYFGNLLNSKLYGIIAPGCIPRVKSAQLEASFEKKSRNFLCLASDFQLKGVDLVLAAWSKVTTYDPTAKLYVVCPNVPHWARNKYSTTNSIIFVNGGPINPSLKHKLYSDCDVSIALTHSHGGGVIAEALEYGHVIISAKWHCSAYEAVTRSIEMPYYFYEPNMYGKKWKTLSEFKELLETDKRSGVFDNVIQDLASEILRYATDHEITNTTRLRNLNCAETGYSLKKRNMMLSEIYQKLI